MSARRRPSIDPMTGEWLDVPVCPSCELIITVNGRDCYDCALAKHSIRRTPATPDPWKETA